jgi:hypothetical protein
MLAENKLPRHERSQIIKNQILDHHSLFFRIDQPFPPSKHKQSTGSYKSIQIMYGSLRLHQQQNKKYRIYFCCVSQTRM